MPKLVTCTNSINVYLCYFFTYFIVSHTHLGKNPSQNKPYDVAICATDGQPCICF